MVRSLWGAHASDVTRETQEGGQMQEGDVDAFTAERRGYGREFGENGFQIVREGGGCAG